MDINIDTNEKLFIKIKRKKQIVNHQTNNDNTNTNTNIDIQNILNIKIKQTKGLNRNTSDKY